MMNQKKSFALRMDAELFEALERWAADEFRSVNGQIEWVLHQQLKASGRLKAPPAPKGAPPPAPKGAPPPGSGKAPDKPAQKRGHLPGPSGQK